jgi:hypothetical protein
MNDAELKVNEYIEGLKKIIEKRSTAGRIAFATLPDEWPPSKAELIETYERLEKTPEQIHNANHYMH